MGRFKAGDRVKILAGHPYIGVGTEGDYVGRANRGYRGKHNVRVTYEDGATSELTFKGRELELIDAPAAQVPPETWEPKVGDRVRRVRHTGIISNCPIGHETTITRLLSHGRGFWYEGKDGSEQNSSRPDDWEVIPSFTIEVGKFYRTRDGRKVGPIEPGWRGGEHPFKCDVNFKSPNEVSVAIWKPDGTNYAYRWLDLVAEWVEPDSPAIAVATPEPAAPPAKFKVGDRVTPKADKLRKVVGHWEEHWQRALAPCLKPLAERSSASGSPRPKPSSPR